MTHGLWRSLLFVPSDNARAVEKARTVAADIVVLDLEDAIAPEAKTQARKALVAAIEAGPFGPRVGVRVNALGTEWGEADLSALSGLPIDLVVAPKVEDAGIVDAYAARMPAASQLVAMIETPRALGRLEQIAGAGEPLAALMLGVNDLSKTLRLGSSADREPLKPWLAAVVAAARGHGLAAIDGVYNRFDDAHGLALECAQGRLFGFDGKSLIHPSQIDTANAAFSPTSAEIDQARAIVDAFEQPDAASRGVVRWGGAMVERLHLDQARAVLDRAAACGIDRISSS